MKGSRISALVRPGRQHGLTLVELMVTIAVWSLLLAGLVSFIVNTNHGYHIQQALNTLNIEGRYAVDTLVREVRMANHWGMSLTASDAALRVAVPPAPTPEIQISQECTLASTGAETGSLQGFAVLDRGGLTTTATGACAGLVQDAGQGNVLMVRYAVADRTSDAAAVQVAAPFVRSRVGATAELFMGGAGGTNPAVKYASGPLSADGSAAAVANYRYHQAYYLVGSAPAPSGLKRVSLSNSTMVLNTIVDNVERLNFFFLVDEPASGGSAGNLQLLTPAEITSLTVGGDPWLQVRATYIELLMRTSVRDLGRSTAAVDNTYSFTQPGAVGAVMNYVVPDAATDSSRPRQYHRQLFSASAHMRNNRPSN